MYMSTVWILASMNVSECLVPLQVSKGQHHLQLVGVVEHEHGESQQRDKVQPCHHQWGEQQQARPCQDEQQGEAAAQGGVKAGGFQDCFQC